MFLIVLFLLYAFCLNGSLNPMAQGQAQKGETGKNGHKNTTVTGFLHFAPAGPPTQRSFRNGQWHTYMGEAALRYGRTGAAPALRLHTSAIYESPVCTSTATTAVHNLTSLC